jgi:hypothetical protein
MTVELIVEVFKHQGVRFDKGAILRDPEIVEWALQHRSTHVMRRASPPRVVHDSIS